MNNQEESHRAQLVLVYQLGYIGAEVLEFALNRIDSKDLNNKVNNLIVGK